MPNAAGLKIIVAHLGDGFYAVENRCTHLGSMLDTSRIYRGRRIACPTHYAQFDLKTGAAKTAPAFRSLATYSVRITDGMITVATSTRI
jgi:nitrite reductase/ring-hydroxylating ferredoxin subunit